MKHATVAIIDYGSQYTQLIARRVRELGVFSFILPADATLARIKKLAPRAIILSGGPSSVYDPGAPALPEGFLEYRASERIPVLGICYGMQLLGRALGGEVEKARVREYGRMEVLPRLGSELFPSVLGTEANHKTGAFQAWMSHGDEIRNMPRGFEVVARSASGAIAAIENPVERIYALQFHPEVTHTQGGKELLRHFLVGIARITPDWDLGSVLDEQIVSIRELVGPKAHVICALSGGVDSCVAASLVHRAIGDRLHCVFVDTGLLRLKERERVMEMFEKRLHLPVQCIDASETFLGKLRGVEDPETKRKIIGSEFITVFSGAAKALEGQLDHLPEFLVQGTLYPDVIESSPPPALQPDLVDEGDEHADDRAPVRRKHSATIKSHHNVGGLPKDLPFKLIEPFRDLFKDEVRELGRRLDVPEEFLRRHPFPGPGLAVRVIGEITPEALEILRNVDEIFIESIRNAGLYDKIWQAFAVFLPIRSVGVQGDGRTHDHVVALRAVTSSDGMTADWYPFEPEFLARVSARICNEVWGVNRVVYDISSKPPATIEWE